MVRIKTINYMIIHIFVTYDDTYRIFDGSSGSFSGLFGILCSVQIFEDPVRIYITNLNYFKKF